MKPWILIVLMAVVSGLFVTSPAAAWGISGSVTEWQVDPIMFPLASPYDIAVLADGTIWITSNPDDSSVAMDLFTLDTASGSFVTYTPDSFSAHYQTIAPAPDGTLWIADKFGSLVHFSPSTHSFNQVLLTDDFPAGAAPYGVSVAADGRVWFTCWENPCIGVYDPGTGVMVPYMLPVMTPVLGFPVEIDFADDGTVWCTIREWAGAKPALGRLDDEETGAMTIWADWSATSPTVAFTNGPFPDFRFLRNPWGIIVNGQDPAEVWFADKNAGFFIHFVEGDTEASGVATWYDIFPILLDTHFIAEDPDGDIWLSSFANRRIGVFDPATSAFSTLDIPSSHQPLGIAISPPDKAVWWVNSKVISASDQGGAGRLVPFTEPFADAGQDRSVLRCESVILDGSGSSDPDGTLISYDWSFGDGTTGSGGTTAHSYTAAGVYSVTLTVTDDDGMTDDDTATITVMTTAQGVTDLKAVLKGMHINALKERVLVSYLDSAQRMISMGMCRQAVTSLQGFNTNVNGMRGRYLTSTQADTLITYSTRIISSIQDCNCR